MSGGRTGSRKPKKTVLVRVWPQSWFCRLSAQVVVTVITWRDQSVQSSLTSRNDCYLHGSLSVALLGLDSDVAACVPRCLQPCRERRWERWRGVLGWSHTDSDRILSQRRQTWNTIAGEAWRSPQDAGVGKGFLKMTPAAQEIRQRADRWDLMREKASAQQRRHLPERRGPVCRVGGTLCQPNIRSGE